MLGKKKRKKIKSKLKRGAEKVAGALDDGQPDEGGPVVDLGKAAGKRSGIKKPVIQDVHREMTRQTVEGIQGWSGTPLNPQMPDGHKFVLLERQAGDVAASLADDSADSEHLYRECIKSGVVALAWAQALKSEAGRRPTQWASA